MLLESHITTCSIRKKNYEKAYLCMFMKQKNAKTKVFDTTYPYDK